GGHAVDWHASSAADASWASSPSCAPGWLPLDLGDARAGGGPRARERRGLVWPRAQRLGQAPCPLLDLRLGNGGVAEQPPPLTGRPQRARGAARAAVPGGSHPTRCRPAWAERTSSDPPVCRPIARIRVAPRAAYRA